MSKELLRKLFIIHKCASCRQILTFDRFDKAMCAKCESAYRVATTESCAQCFRSAIECTCQPKLLSDSGSLCFRKLFFYHTDKADEPQNRLIYLLKRTPAKRAFVFLADEMLGIIKNELEALGIDDVSTDVVVTHLPRSRKARMLYGFDQSKEICRRISELSGIPYVELLHRRYGGKEQKKLNATQRRRNIKKLMRPRKGAFQSVCGKYVILIDDVVTTGASMSAGVPILRKMGVKGVICAAIAADVKKKSNI